MSYTPPTFHEAREQAKRSRKAFVEAMIQTFPVGCQIRRKNREDDAKAPPVVVGHREFSCELVVYDSRHQTLHVSPELVTHRKLVGWVWDSVEGDAEERQPEEEPQVPSPRQVLSDVAIKIRSILYKTGRSILDDELITVLSGIYADVTDVAAAIELTADDEFNRAILTASRFLEEMAEVNTYNNAVSSALSDAAVEVKRLQRGRETT